MSDTENKSYKNLGFISDRTQQFRIFSEEPKASTSDQDFAEVLETFQPLSKYKAACKIVRGQAVSIATADQLNKEQLENEDTYVVLSDPKFHETTLGLALNNVEEGQFVQIQSYGRIKLESKDYMPIGLTYEGDVGKTVWVSGKENEQGNLTTDSNDVYYNPDSNILQIGIIADVNANDILVEINIEGDQRGPIDATQFELELAEPFTSIEKPVIFALSHEEAHNSVVFIKKLKTDYSEAEKANIKNASNIIVHHNRKLVIFKFGDDSRLSFRDMNTIRYFKTQLEDKNAITEVDVSKIENFEGLIEKIVSTLNDTFTGETFKADPINDEAGHYSTRIKTTEPVSTVDYYFTDAMIMPNHPFHGSVVEYFGCAKSNFGKAVIADIRNPERQNIIGVFNSKNYGKVYGLDDEYKKAIFMRYGRWSSSEKNFAIEENKVGSYGGLYLYLGTNGEVTRNPYNIFNRQIKIGSILNDTSFLIDPESLNVKPSAVMPIGGITLCPIINTEDGEAQPVADEGYLVCDGETPIEYERFPELYDYLLQYYSKDDLAVNEENKTFVIPEIRTGHRFAQIKAFAESEFINTKLTFFKREFGTFGDKESPITIKDIDISELCNSYAVYTNGSLLEQFTLRLFVKTAEEEWTEVHEGLHSENGVNTYGFNWKLCRIKDDDEDDAALPRFILKADVSNSTDGIRIHTGPSSPSQSVENLEYYVFIAQTRYFDERIDMSRYWLAYHSDAILVEDMPTERPVTGIAVAAFVNEIVETLVNAEDERNKALYGYVEEDENHNKHIFYGQNVFYCDYEVNGSYTFVLRRDEKDRILEKLVFGQKIDATGNRSAGSLYHITYEFDEDGNLVKSEEECLDDFARKLWVEKLVEDTKAKTLEEAAVKAAEIADVKDVETSENHLILENQSIKKIEVVEDEDGNKSTKANANLGIVKANIDKNDYTLDENGVEVRNDKKSDFTLSKRFGEEKANLVLEADRQTQRTFKANKVRVDNVEFSIQPHVEGTQWIGQRKTQVAPSNINNIFSVVYDPIRKKNVQTLDVAKFINGLKYDDNHLPIDSSLYVTSTKNRNCVIKQSGKTNSILLDSVEYTQKDRFYERNKTYNKIMASYVENGFRYLIAFDNVAKTAKLYDGNVGESTFEFEKVYSITKSNFSSLTDLGKFTATATCSGEGETLEFDFGKNDDGIFLKINENPKNDVILYEFSEGTTTQRVVKESSLPNSDISLPSSDGASLTYRVLASTSDILYNFHNGNYHYYNTDETNLLSGSLSSGYSTKLDAVADAQVLVGASPNNDGSITYNGKTYKLRNITFTYHSATSDEYKSKGTYGSDVEESDGSYEIVDDGSGQLHFTENMTFNYVESATINGVDGIIIKYGSGKYFIPNNGYIFNQGHDAYYSISYGETFNTLVTDVSVLDGQFEEFDIVEWVDINEENRQDAFSKGALQRESADSNDMVCYLEAKGCRFEIQLITLTDETQTFRINELDGSSTHIFVNEIVDSMYININDEVIVGKIGNEEDGYATGEGTLVSSSINANYKNIEYVRDDGTSVNANVIYDYIYHDRVAKFTDGGNNPIPIVTSSVEHASKAEYKKLKEEDINNYGENLQKLDFEETEEKLFEGSALHAVYETPATRFEYKNASKGDKDQIGIVVDRLNFITEDKNGISSVLDENGVKTNPRQIFDLPKPGDDASAEEKRIYELNNFSYTKKQIQSIKDYLRLETNRMENAENLTTVVGIHNKALKETFIRLLRNEVTLNGWDADTIPGEKRDEFSGEESIKNEPTTLGLNRLVRALCREVFYKEDPDTNDIKTYEDENDTSKNITRIDRIDGDINGKDYERESSVDNDEAFKKGTTYPSLDKYTEENEKYFLKDVNSKSFDEDDFKKGEGEDIKIEDKPFQDYLNGESNEVFTSPYEEREDAEFDGLKDAVARISAKLNKVTKDVYGHDNVLDSPRTLDILQLYSGATVEELFFSSPDFKPENGRDEIKNHQYYSRLDLIDDILYPEIRVERNITDTLYEGTNIVPYGLDKFYKGYGPVCKVEDDIVYSVLNLRKSINKKEDYVNNLNIVDLIKHSLGDALILTKEQRATSRSANNVGKRLDELEEFAHIIANAVLVGKSLENSGNGEGSWPTLYGKYKAKTTDYTDYYADSGKFKSIQSYLDFLVEFLGVRYYGGTVLNKFGQREMLEITNGKPENTEVESFRDFLNKHSNINLVENLVGFKDMYGTLLMLAYYNSLNYHFLRRDRTAIGSFIQDNTNKFDYKDFGIEVEGINEDTFKVGLRDLDQQGDGPENGLFAGSSYQVYDLYNVLSKALENIYSELTLFQYKEPQKAGDEETLDSYVEYID